MCGITIYKGIPIEIQKVWDSMLEIKHRGDEDGFGYIDVTNGSIVKSILTIEEIEEEKLDKSRADEWKKKTMESMTKRIHNIKQGFKVKTGFIALHNRNASCGDIDLNNTHPIKINNNVYYIHNGSVEGTELMKDYFTLKYKSEFKSQTDSELLGFLVEKELENGLKPKEIYTFLDKLCVSGFGVLVRVDMSNDTMTIFKCIDRSLYITEDKNSFLIMSEPIVTSEGLKCIRLDEGVITIGDKINLSECKYKDVTKKLNEAFKKEHTDYKCDSCSNKGHTRRLFDMKDFCLVCCTLDEDPHKLVESTNRGVNMTKPDSETIAKFNSRFPVNYDYDY